MSVLGFLTAQVLILVLLRGKSNQALPVNVDSQRIVASHDNVKSQVKLVPLNQQRVVQVS